MDQLAIVKKTWPQYFCCFIVAQVVSETFSDSEKLPLETTFALDVNSSANHPGEPGEWFCQKRF